MSQYIACPHKANSAKIIKDVLSYSKGVQKKSVKDGIKNEELNIFLVWRKNEKRWPWRTESPVLYTFGF